MVLKLMSFKCIFTDLLKLLHTYECKQLKQVVLLQGRLASQVSYATLSVRYILN